MTRPLSSVALALLPFVHALAPFGVTPTRFVCGDRRAGVARHPPLQGFLGPDMPVQLLAAFGDSIAAADASAPLGFDALDLVLASPLLLPVFALWALRATGSATGSLLQKSRAEAAREVALKQVAALERKLEAEKAKTAAAEETTVRKVKFWEGKLNKQRSEALSVLRGAKAELRKEIEKAEARERAANEEVARLKEQMRTLVAPPPPPPSTSPDPAVLASLKAAEERAAAAEAALAQLQAAQAEASAPADEEEAKAEEAAPAGEVEHVSSAGAVASSQHGRLKVTPPGEVGKRLALQAGLQPGDTVLVTGAAGPTGRLVVEALLRAYPGVKVRAHSSQRSKLDEALREIGARVGIELVQKANNDLELPGGVYEAVSGVSAVVWCASSFGGDKPDRSVLEELQYQMKGGAPLVLDAAGVAQAAEALASTTALLPEAAETVTPKFVLLSSAAVSRRQWSPEVQNAFSEAAQIPIVQLNPENILDVKFQGEQSLRSAGVPYCIVRPCGINADHPPGRYVLSSGDMATGRISRQDVAELLVAALSEPSAQGKTMEVFTLPGLPKRPLAPVLTALPADAPDGPPPPDPTLYSILKQLGPGTSQSSVPAGASKPN